jgi:hypothetical protein
MILIETDKWKNKCCSVNSYQEQITQKQDFWDHINFIHSLFIWFLIMIESLK